MEYNPTLLVIAVIVSLVMLLYIVTRLFYLRYWYGITQKELNMFTLYEKTHIGSPSKTIGGLAVPMGLPPEHYLHIAVLTHTGQVIVYHYTATANGVALLNENKYLRTALMYRLVKGFKGNPTTWVSVIDHEITTRKMLKSTLVHHYEKSFC